MSIALLNFSIISLFEYIRDCLVQSFPPTMTFVNSIVYKNGYNLSLSKSSASEEPILSPFFMTYFSSTIFIWAFTIFVII
jgi:hypothetical protein